MDSHATPVARAADRPADEHTPVLLRETLELLAPALTEGGWAVDCTLGMAGHAEALLDACPRARLLGIDRDLEARERAARRLDRFGDRVRIVAGRFGDLADVLDTTETPAPRAILADIGVSSRQLDVPERGFSFSGDGPLDMRMDAQSADDPTAAHIVNTYPEAALAELFHRYGEERHARRIAREIAARRDETPFETTGQLARLLEQLQPRPRRPRRASGGKGRRGGPDRGLHPATRVFQALRIEVNQELDELRRLIDDATERLDVEGRLVVISYHSLEDRIVKHGLRDLAAGRIEPVTGQTLAESQLIEVLTKKPVRPSEAEIEANPRSRSARLRAARRL